MEPHQKTIKWGAPVGDQRTFAGIAWERKGKVTRREGFLNEMEQIIPWKSLLDLIEPHYPKSGVGRRPMELEMMFRIYLLQLWFDLSDPQAEDTLYDSESMRRFARVELGEDTVPDESTILRFRHLIERENLAEQIFEQINSLLIDKRLMMRAGTIVDATIISAPSSTKNATDSRDPEMRQTRKGKSWYFGMKLHVGTDRRGLVHTVVGTDAARADIKEMPNLLHGEEREIFGDQAYWKEADRVSYEQAGIRYRINRRGHYKKPLTEYQKKINRARSGKRALGEHAFRVVKQLWGFSKTRYRGIAKNTSRAMMMFGLANLYMVRQKLGPPQPKCL